MRLGGVAILPALLFAHHAASSDFEVTPQQASPMPPRRMDNVFLSRMGSSSSACKKSCPSKNDKKCKKKMKKIRKLCGRSYCKDSCKDVNTRKKEREETDPTNSEPRKCCNAACRCRNIGSGCPSAAKKVRDLERSCRRRKKRRKRRSNLKKACCNRKCKCSSKGLCPNDQAELNALEKYCKKSTIAALKPPTNPPPTNPPPTSTPGTDLTPSASFLGRRRRLRNRRHRRQS